MKKYHLTILPQEAEDSHPCWAGFLACPTQPLTRSRKIYSFTRIDIRQILDYAREKQGTDIHICAGPPVLFRIGRELTAATQGRLTAQMIQNMTFEPLSKAV